MRSPSNPELSFLIESLHLSPDVVFEVITKTELSSDVVNRKIVDITKADVGMQDLRHYNQEAVDSFGRYVSEHKWGLESGGLASVFEFIRKIANDFLMIRDNEPFFKIDKIDDWQQLSLKCGEDLFVAAMLVDKNIHCGYTPRNFQWRYILRSDFSLLNNLIAQNKIVENHYHLGGSSPMVDLSWIYLMNHPFCQDEKFEDFLSKQDTLYNKAYSLQGSYQSNIVSLLKMAAYIRLVLFEKCVLHNTANHRDNDDSRSEKPILEENCLKKAGEILRAGASSYTYSDEIENRIAAYRFSSPFSAFDTKVDYAINAAMRVNQDECNSYIAGERQFNYCCLKHIFTNHQDSSVRSLYYLYLLVKHRFNGFFIQSNNKTGFQNFFDYNDRKGSLVRNTEYKEMADNMAIEGNIKESCLSQLEVRIMPDTTSKEVTDYINKVDNKAFFRSSRISYHDRINPRDSQGRLKYGDGTDWFFYVLHFIKGKDNCWNIDDDYKNAPMCREAEKRSQFLAQAENLVEMRDNNEEVCKRIFGIDAASNEVNFRPENFGTVFRYLASSYIRQDVPWRRKIPDLRKTYHVGEDFYEVVDGLRAIDEAVLYLELSQGDRIGHGVALGIDIDKWYERHPRVDLPLQNKLDNIAWMLYKIREWGLSVSTAYYEKLMTEFERLFYELYKEPSSGLLTYMMAWELRGDDPIFYLATSPEERWLHPVTPREKASIRDMRRFREIYKIAQRNGNSKAYELYHRYHFDTELKKVANKIVSHKFNQDEYAKERIALVKQIQKRMRSFILDKGIVVESCPTSNFLISNLDEFKEIPTFNLFPIRESHAEFERLNTCINTDDQGVFYTNLVKEYTLLVGALRQRKVDNVRELSDDKILNWVKHLIDASKQHCFRTGVVENYGIKSDNNLFKDVRMMPMDGRYVLPGAF